MMFSAAGNCKTSDKMEYLRKADGTVQEEGNDKAKEVFALIGTFDVRLERQSISIINLCSLTFRGTASNQVIVSKR